MNVSYEWLRSFVALDETPAQLRDLITAHTATVEELHALREDLASIVVGRVVESQAIPETKLTANRVDVGAAELVEVVCGAPNVTVGKLYPFAPSGTVMPEGGNKPGLKLEKRKIRGFMSNGMLCSARELALGADADGIWELDLDVAPGTPLLQAIPVGDTQLVIDVLANRPDLLSHLGIAREVAAITGRGMALPRFEGDGLPVPAPVAAPSDGSTAGVRVRLEAGARCRRYMGVVIRGITVGPSPEWLRHRLAAVGARSINNVVDATNYVLWEMGQPTHAFDLAKLAGPEVMVRLAREGEAITTLDGTARTLDARAVVIADAKAPIAIAGVMGGRDSEVTEATTDLFLEVASFDPALTRVSRRALGLSTDASYRFERGVDPALAPGALERCARLIVALAGGRIDGAPVDLGGEPATPAPVALRAARVARVLGGEVSAGEIGRLLQGIGFAVEPGPDGALRVTPPSWRSDVTAEIDLIEEVARLRGYDSFPDTLQPGRPSAVPDAPMWTLAARVRDALVGEGLLEARPLPFVSGAEEGFVRVANPLAENEAYLRTEVLDTLARRAEHNLAHMQGNVRLFEVGAVFTPRASGEAMPDEELRVGILVMGDREPVHFTQPQSPVYDEWDAKWLGEVVARAAYPGARVALEPSADPEALWEILVGGEGRGVVRRLVLDAPVWAAPAFGVELSLSAVTSAQVAAPGANAHGGTAAVGPSPAARTTRYRPLPTTPAAEFDLALLVRDDLPAAEVERVIRRTAGELLESLVLFDRYQGKGVDEGYRSLAWRLTFRHPERTLRDKEIEGRRAKILSTLQSELDVRPRTS
ncbi:MAG TPA: phenylalanine--tRNA ligase subunit beta [Gemmatimonadaceae bacterium]